MGLDTRLRVGIVGANPDYGWVSGVHRPVVQSLPDYRLHGVCTTREESSRRAAAEFGAALSFMDSTALAEHPEIDVVAVCVRAPAHYEIAHAALAAGKHIYCEWPLAFSVAQADELARMAGIAGSRR